MNYYAFHIGDYVSATQHLTDLEDLAYRRMMDLYYMTERPLPLDRRQLYRLLRANSEAMREAVDVVILEFFTEDENGWRHGRCDAEIDKARAKSDKAKANGKLGGVAKAKRTLPETIANATHNPSECLAPKTKTKTKTKTNICDYGLSRSKPKTELPDNWQPDPATWALADSLGFQSFEAQDQLERMRDWARNADGGKGRKSDWNAAFRNWLKRAADDKKHKPHANLKRHSIAESFNVLDAVVDEAIRRTDGPRAEGSETNPGELRGLRKSAA